MKKKDEMVFSDFIIAFILAGIFFVLTYFLSSMFIVDLREKGSFLFFIGPNLIFHLSFILVILFFCKVIYNRSFLNTVSLIRVPKKTVIHVCLIGVLTYFIIAGLASFFHVKAYDESTKNLFREPSNLLVYAIYLCSLKPFLEEVVWRGFVYPSMSREWGIVAGFLVSCCLSFLLTSFSPAIGILSAFFLLIQPSISTLIRIYYKSTSAAVLFHLACNVTSIIVFIVRLISR